jgi:hypothetical protein
MNIQNTKYRTIYFPLVLYGCETWSLMLREEYTLESIAEQGDEEDTWAEDSGNNTGMEKTV